MNTQCTRLMVDSHIRYFVMRFRAREVFFSIYLKACSHRAWTTAASTFLPSATKLWQGYVFTPLSVILFTGGVCLSACWDIHPPPGADPPPSRHSPRAVHAGRYGQQAGGTHPTGMHTCWHNAFELISQQYLCTEWVQDSSMVWSAKCITVVIAYFR